MEYWDDLQELSLDYEPDSIAARFGSSYFAQKIRETYGFVGGNDLAMPYALPIDEDITNSVDTRLVLDVAVFVDQNMATQLEKEYETAEDQVNAVLSALNAVQVIFDDDSFGDQKLRIRVKRVIIDQTGKVFKGDKCKVGVAWFDRVPVYYGPFHLFPVIFLYRTQNLRFFR